MFCRSSARSLPSGLILPPSRTLTSQPLLRAQSFRTSAREPVCNTAIASRIPPSACHKVKSADLGSLDTYPKKRLPGHNGPYAGRRRYASPPCYRPFPNSSWLPAVVNETPCSGRSNLKKEVATNGYTCCSNRVPKQDEKYKLQSRVASSRSKSA